MIFLKFILDIWKARNKSVTMQLSLIPFGENQLLWLRDMTPQVPGGQAIFEEKCVFFTLFLGEKAKNVDKKQHSV